MMDLSLIKDEVQKSINNAGLRGRIEIEPEGPEGYECKFVGLLKEKELPQTTDLEQLCHHEEECKIMSRLIKKFKKTKPELALILTLKIETYKNQKLPKGKLCI